MHETTVHLALGSNEGDREGHLRRALQRLGSVPGVRVGRVSSFRESEFVGEGPQQGPFLNAVAELQTTLPPTGLLAVLQAIEFEAGRRPGPRNHPRPLDLDIVFFGDQQLDTKDLVVPHPRWHLREFVKTPLAELGVDIAKRPRNERPAVIEAAADFAAKCSAWQQGGCTIGLVPTMGALHRGHKSLMDAARRENDRVAVTIFVNPLQFAPNEDFAAYPRDLSGDLRICADAGVDAVFAPGIRSMYEPEFASHVATGAAGETMEGAVRPGHFSGVATVVARLFALSRPHRAYFGEKDAQQLAVIRRLVADLGFPLRIMPCPIVREPDGLALSSRNVYLGAEDRRAATVLYRALRSVQQAFASGERDRDRLLERARTVIAAEPRAQLDYVELRRDADLQPLPPGRLAGGRLLIAAKFRGGARPVRLLDNALIEDDLPAHGAPEHR